MLAGVAVLAFLPSGSPRQPHAMRTCPAPLMRSSNRQDPARRRLMGNYMKELDQLREAPPEEACVLAMAKLSAMEADGFRPNRNVLALAIGLCSTDLAEAEALFARLVEFPEGATEGACMSLLRAQLAEGELDRALGTWEHMLEHGITPRPRTSSPLIVALCKARRGDAAVRLYRYLGEQGLERTEEVYSAVFTMHGALGERRQALAVLSDMLGDFPRPSAPAVAGVVALFERLDLESAAAAPQGGDGETVPGGADAERESVRDSAGSAAAARVDPPPAGARRVLLDAAGGCPCCGAELEVLRLSPEECDSVRSVLLSRAAERMGEQGAGRLRRFARWIKEQPPFDYVVDGPNVGYANQNFDSGRFEFSQIAAVIRVLQRAGKRVLLILPSKYAQDVIPNHTSAEQRNTKISAVDRAIIDDWKQQRIVYLCGSGLYDDWYWMLATVSGDKPPLAVTNDAMRDHINELLPRRAFARWRHSQIVPFTISRYAPETPPRQSHPPRAPPLLVHVAAPPLFTPESQRLHGRWHIPIPGDADEEEWLCCTADVPARPTASVWPSAAEATAVGGGGAGVASHLHTHPVQAEEAKSSNEGAAAQ